MVDNVAEIDETLRTLMQISMTWWVSATVLCASILGASWVRRRDIRKAGPLTTRWLFGSVTMFFLTIVAYGVTSAVSVADLGNQLQIACDATPGRCTPGYAALMSSRMQIGLWIGTSSFILYTIAWVWAGVLVFKAATDKPSSAWAVNPKPAKISRKP
jgi:hypothetical protein